MYVYYHDITSHFCLFIMHFRFTGVMTILRTMMTILRTIVMPLKETAAAMEFASLLLLEVACATQSLRNLVFLAVCHAV